MRILYLGDLSYGSNSRSMAVALKALYSDTRAIDTRALNKPKRFSPAWLYKRVTRGQAADWVEEAALRAVRKSVRSFKPDVVFCYKTVAFDQQKLHEALGQLMRVHYSADDVANPENISDDYLAHESEWDLVVTTKRHNVPELEARTSARIAYLPSAYDPRYHLPWPAPPAEVRHVGFIGTCRTDRLRTFHSLGRDFPGDVALYGEHWRKHYPMGIRGVQINRGQYGEEFSRAVSGLRCNLILLNSSNRDQHTCRSFEVPAAGGLAVAERTKEHLEMLEDEREALYFSSSEELTEQLKRVAADPALGRRIAEAGHRRIVDGRNTYQDRVETLSQWL